MAARGDESRAEQNDMRILVAIGLACLCVYGPTPKTCADCGGVLIFSNLLGGGLVCVKPPGKIPLERAKP